MYLKINPDSPQTNKIKKTVTAIKNGAVIAYPTDTVYGLGCDIFNKQAVNKIYNIKKRDKKKPLSILCADFKQASQYVIIPDYAFKLMKKILPGPYTFILKARNNMPKNILAKNKTVGIRIPDNQFCLQITKQLGSPIITTSLNISGEQNIKNLQELSKEIRNKIDLMLDAGYLPDKPSTIIDLSQDEIEIIRKGQGDLNFIDLKQPT
ncbi:MAG: threonylcarbamoyl-AMP synthase [Candidatus Buchananbacteria bacterium]|nr:threonylcarbamoyl-AMP synthase [Candidatus Buchananbacteria bacterium]